MVNYDVEPVLNLTLNAMRFEQRMKIKMNENEVLFKSEISYSLELSFSHGVVSGSTSLSIVLLKEP